MEDDMAISNTSVFKPLDCDKQLIQGSTFPSGINTSSITAVWPGELLEYNMEYDIDELKMSGLPEDQQNEIFKKELATQLVNKMMADGHIIFTKQNMIERHAMRFKAYTWVGNKNFIEERRKEKSRGIR